MVDPEAMKNSSFSNTKRSLSDPEIHFAAPLQNLLNGNGHSGPASPYQIILRVNPKLEQNGKEVFRKIYEGKDKHKVKDRAPNQSC